MKIVVTGATGYIGGNLVRHLIANGHEPVCYALDDIDRALLPDAITDDHIVTGDAIQLTAAFKRLGVEAVIHLASLVSPTGAPESIEPMLTANVVFGAKVAYAAANAGVAMFVNVSSFWVHGTGEAHVMPNTLYAASKAAFERILAYYTYTSPLRSITLEFTDVYGPDDRRRKFLDLVHESATTGQPLAATAGEQLMSIVHVKDVATALEVAAAETGEENAQVFSIAADEFITLRQVVEVYEAATGRSANVEWGALPYPPQQVMKPYLHTRLPGWEPRITLAQGLAVVYGEGQTRD